MIEDLSASKYLFSGFRVDVIIDRHQQSSPCQRFGNHLPQALPKPLPWDLGRCHECIVTLFLDAANPEEAVEALKQVRGLGRRKWNDDRNECVGKPSSAFFCFSGIGKFAFEFCKDVV